MNPPIPAQRTTSTSTLTCGTCDHLLWRHDHLGCWERIGPDAWCECSIEAPAPDAVVIPESNPLGRGLVVGLLIALAIWVPLSVLAFMSAGWL